MHLQGMKGEAEIYLIAHAARQGQLFNLPPLPPGQQWRCFVDTTATPASHEPGEEHLLVDQQSYAVAGESVVVLVITPQ